jgi:hypothetical protein
MNVPGAVHQHEEEEEESPISDSTLCVAERIIEKVGVMGEGLYNVYIVRSLDFAADAEHEWVGSLAV